MQKRNFTALIPPQNGKMWGSRPFPSANGAWTSAHNVWQTKSQNEFANSEKNAKSILARSKSSHSWEGETRALGCQEGLEGSSLWRLEGNPPSPTILTTDISRENGE